MTPTRDTRRRTHMDALRRALMARGSATRAQLAGDTGLTAMTVGKLLTDMERRGEVSQRASDASSGGRPSVIAAYNADFAHYATVSVTQAAQGSAFRLSAFNMLGERVRTSALRVADVRQDSFDAWLSQTAAALNLRLVSFALPGEADGDNVFLCDFEALLYTGFLPRIRRLFGVQTVFENDVNAAVLGHDFSGGGNRAGVYFPMRYPPGAGLLVDGKIVHGARHFAGEISYLHGMQAWRALDYGDAARVAGMATDVLTAIACVVAPEGIVLYGDFLSEPLRAQIQERLAARLGRQIAPRLLIGDMAEDMERGAARLGRERLLEVLAEETP